MHASSIYDWFAVDYGGFDDGITHLLRYARPTLARQLAGLKKIDAYACDWKLNDLQW